MKKDDEMSNTFVSEVGQKSAIFNQDTESELEELTEEQEKNDSSTQLQNSIESDKLNENQQEEDIKEEEDTEFLEAKKKKKNKKYKKRNPFTMLLIIIICLVLGALASYYYFEIYQKPTEKEKKPTTTTAKVVEEQLDPDSIFVKQLIQKYDFNADEGEQYTQLYLSEKTIPDNLSQDYLKKIGVNNLTTQAYGISTFTSDELEKSIKELVGDSNVVHSDIIFKSCYIYKYNEDTKTYTLEKTENCDINSEIKTYRKITKAVKKDQKITLTVAIAIADSESVYKSKNINDTLTDKLEGLTPDNFDIDKEYTQLNQYTYTFDYNKNTNSYILDSIKLIK